MEMCPDEQKRFPSHVAVIVVDNLNGAEANYESEGVKYKDVTKRTSFAKFMADVEKQDAVNQFLEALDSFKSVVFCQTAPGKHWGMPGAIDEIADNVRMRARKKNIATLDITHFWKSIKAFMGEDSMKVVPSEQGGNAGATYS